MPGEERVRFEDLNAELRAVVSAQGAEITPGSWNTSAFIRSSPHFARAGSNAPLALPSVRIEAASRSPSSRHASAPRASWSAGRTPCSWLRR